MNLRRFLMRSPRPDTIRVFTSDGVKEVAVRGAWSHLANTIATLDPSKLELYQSGQLLRAIPFAELDGIDDDPQDLAPEQQAQRGGTLTLEELSAQDPETRRMLVFQRLLAEAYRHSNDHAFNAMMHLFEQVNRRSEALEASLGHANRLLQKLAEEQIQAEVERAQNQDPLADLASSFMGGVQSGQAAKTNGSKD